MLNKITAILECSRIFSLPMTIMSWLIIFTYSFVEAGNAWYGIVALIGICFAHLATNVFDDYFDYQNLIKQANFNKVEYLKNSQKTKCRYILLERMSLNEVLLLGLSYLGIAGVIGLFFLIKCGIGVLYFAITGGILVVLYSFLSKIRLSEFAVAIAYGPALFGGVYYVMTNSYSWKVFLLSIPSMLITVVLLYIHTIMDYDFDINEGKKTIANIFDSQLDALIVLKILLISAYFSLIFLCVFDILDWQVFLTLLTIPLSVDLYNSLQDFSVNPKSIPVHKWYHFPMENLEYLEKINAKSFMMRMYQSRNLMIYFSLLYTLSVVLSLWV